MQTEIYSVDINKDSKLIVYGGKDNICYLLDYETLQTIYEIDDFKDSIAYSRFTNNKTFLVCSLEGTIGLYCFNSKGLEETERTEVGDDITSLSIHGNFFYVGTASGTIHVYNELASEKVYSWHNTEIKEIIVRDSIIYSLSENRLITYSEEEERVIEKINVRDANALCLTPCLNVKCVGSKDSVYFYRNGKIIKDIKFEGAETICYINGYFLIGGSCDYILLVDFKNNLREFKLNFKVENLIKSQTDDVVNDTLDEAVNEGALDGALMALDESGDSTVDEALEDAINEGVIDSALSALNQPSDSDIREGFLETESAQSKEDLPDKSNTIDGISRIESVGEYHILFSTFCGKIGLGDFRNENSFKFYDSGVGTVFDFHVNGNIVLVGGEMGVNLINIESPDAGKKFEF